MTNVLPPLHEGHAPITLQQAFREAIDAFEEWDIEVTEPIVMFDGRIVGVVKPDISREDIGLMMAGAGEKAFVAGADISEFTTLRAGAEGARRYSQAVAEGEGALIAFPKPASGSDPLTGAPAPGLE